MRHLVLVVPAMIVCLLGCTSVPKNELAQKSADNTHDLQIATARQHEHRGENQQAEKIYQELLAEAPEHPAANHRLGVLEVKRGMLSEGLTHLQVAYNMSPDNAEILADIGYALYLQDRLDEAAGALREALSRDPANKRALNNLGLVAGKQGRLQEANAIFRQAGNSAEAFSNLGYVEAQRGNLAEAERHYSQALDHDGDLRVAAEGLLQIAEQRERGGQCNANLAARASSEAGLVPLELRKCSTEMLDLDQPQLGQQAVYNAVPRAQSEATGRIPTWVAPGSGAPQHGLGQTPQMSSPAPSPRQSARQFHASPPVPSSPAVHQSLSPRDAAQQPRRFPPVTPMQQVTPSDSGQSRSDYSRPVSPQLDGGPASSSPPTSHWGTYNQQQLPLPVASCRTSYYQQQPTTLPPYKQPTHAGY